MNKQNIDKFVSILRRSHSLNLKNPTELAHAKKILDMANKLKGVAAGVPELNAELIKFYDNVGARPEVAGIRTTVQGSLWDLRTRGN